jgi:hypothetical protein
MAKVTQRQSNFPQIGGEGVRRQVKEQGTGKPKLTAAGNPEMAWKFPLPGSFREGSPEHVAATANFLHSIRNAPEATVRSGLQWYPKVNEAVQKGITGRGSRGFLSSQADRHKAGSALVAALSPNMDWDKANIHALSEVRGLRQSHWDRINAGDASSLEGMSISKASLPNLQKAGRIIAGEHPDDVLPMSSAPKTHSFMQNIADPSNPHFVTIDGRAFDTLTNRARPWESARGIGGDVDAKSPPGRYIGARNVVQGVAERLGRAPSEVQAISWEHTKYNIEQAGVTARGKPRKQGPSRVGQPYFHPETGEPVLHLPHLSGQFGHL